MPVATPPLPPPEPVPTTLQIEPSKKLYWLVLVLKTSNPAAGAAIASLCAWVIRGAKKPLLVESSSNKAEEFGVVVLKDSWLVEAL